MKRLKGPEMLASSSSPTSHVSEDDVGRNEMGRIEPQAWEDAEASLPEVETRERDSGGCEWGSISVACPTLPGFGQTFSCSLIGDWGQHN